MDSEETSEPCSSSADPLIESGQPGGVEVTGKKLLSEVVSQQDLLKASLTKCVSEKTVKRKSAGGARKSISTNTSSTRSLHLLSEHIDVLQNLKAAYTERFILDLREEIKLMWVKCCYGESQQNTFELFKTSDFSDEVLIEHEKELKKLKDYFATHRDLYKLVSKREKLWKEKVAFENPPDGCSRFENRGGTLIKELKRYQVVEKQLPLAEKEIKLKIKSWEKENQTRFLMHDLKYVEYIDTQKSDYKLQQEAKRAAKKAAKQEELLAEMSSSSGSNTISKKSSVADGNISKPTREVSSESLKELSRPTSSSLLKSRNFSTPASRSRLSVHSSSLKRSAPMATRPTSDTPKMSNLDLSHASPPSKENDQPSASKKRRTDAKIRPVLQTSAMKRKMQRKSLAVKNAVENSIK